MQTSCTTQQHTAALQVRFTELFQPGLGLCSTTEAVLRLQPEVTPVFRPKRPVPYASLPSVDTELQRLETKGVLVPVSYSSWAAPIVVVKKSNGSIRICADFSTGLNAALQQHHYPLPSPDDLFTTLPGGTYFAKLDLADAYLQISVAPESRELLTIKTHRGLFQYTRLPFGIKTAPAIFQQIMDTILADVPGVPTCIDDVLIVGSTADELYTRTQSVLHSIQDNGFRLRPGNANFSYVPLNISVLFLMLLDDILTLKVLMQSDKCLLQLMSPHCDHSWEWLATIHHSFHHCMTYDIH